MAIKVDGSRQWPLVGKITVSLADITSGVADLVDKIPGGCQLKSMYVNVLTPFDSGTSDALTIGDADTPNLYGSGIDISTAGIKAATLTGKKYSVPTALSLQWDGAGTAATQGEFELVFEYIADGRTNEVVPARS